MRILVIPALALIMGFPAFAKDGRQDWKYRTRRPHGPEIGYEHESRARRDWDHPRFEHWRPFRHHGRERVIVHPAPIHAHPLPPPPPPPRFEHRRPFRHHDHERVIVHPAPVHVHPLPLPPPPPPPVGIHVWFGF